MTAELPEIVPSVSDDGEHGVIVVGDREYMAMGDLVAAIPGLRDNAVQMALAVNGLTQRLDFDVILDPEAFEVASRDRIAREKPGATFRQGSYRLRDFGMPRFSAIHAPAIKGDRLVFFAVQSLTGLPYRVEAGRDGNDPVYVPAPLDAIDAVTEAEALTEEIDTRVEPADEEVEYREP